MNPDHLPDNLLLRIVNLLPIKERFRCDRISKQFHRFSQMKSIDQDQRDQLARLDGRASLTPDGLSALLELCRHDVEHLRISASMADTFLSFSYPRLRELQIDLYLDSFNDAFDFLMRVAPNLDTLTLRVMDSHLQSEFHSTGAEHEKLRRLSVRNMNNGAILRKLAGYFPNLEEFRVSCQCEAFLNDEAEHFEEFLSRCPKLESLGIDGHGFTNFFAVESLWKLNSLRELDICPGKWDTIVPRMEDIFLTKIAYSFPNLETLRLDHLEMTSRGVLALMSFKKLHTLWLDDVITFRDEASRG